MNNKNNGTKESIRVKEIRELRTENRKVFRMSDGSEQAVFYPGAVHVLDADTGKYTDTDMTLSMDADSRHYRNGKGRFTARFSCEEDNNEVFAVEQGVHRITVFAGKNRTPKLRQKAKHMAGCSDVLVFENMQTGTDLEYVLTSCGVKENILVKEKQESYRYPFTLHCENVTVNFQESSKRVAFCSTKTGEEVFFIPAPFIEDKNGMVSTDVSYEVKAEDNGEIQLTVVADSRWMNAEGREFPVTVDPQLKVSETGFMSTYSWQGGSMYNGTAHNVGTTGIGDGDSNAMRMYMHITMPTLARAPRIRKAELTLYQSSGTCADETYPKLGLYQVTEEISTGICTPAHNSDLIDFARMKVDSGEDGQLISYTFDITKLLDQINKNEESSFNLVLKMLDETLAGSNSVMLYGSSGSNAPELQITYESSYGVNTAYRTHTHQIGRFGQGSIDLACGNLMFECEDFAWAGSRMPVTIKHLFNSALAGYPYTYNSAIRLETADFSAMKLGYGYRLNLMQSMRSAASDYEDEYSYIHIGENGEETYFKEGTAQRSDAENNSYKLHEDVNGSDMIYDPYQRTLESGGEIRLFDTSGRLIRITDEYGSHMDITYTSDRITAVTDGAGRSFSFVYDSNGFLTSITAPDNAGIAYAYTDNLLTQITYPDGRKAQITWSNNQPTAVVLQDADGADVYKVSYMFMKGQMVSVWESGVKDGTFTSGHSTLYDYSAAARRTYVYTTESSDSAAGEIINNYIYYTFDDAGDIISEYVCSRDTGNVGVEGEESGIHPHGGDGGAGIVSNINNLLLGHDFYRLENWADMEGNADNCITNYYTSEIMTRYGQHRLGLTTSGASLENGVYQLTGTLPAGQYTFSAYLWAYSAFTGVTNPGAYIRVRDTSGNVLAQSERIFRKDSDYVRMVAPFELASAQSVRVEILADGNGTVFANAPQLEKNPFANDYNMLENGNFEHSLTGWLQSDGVSISTGTRFDMSGALMLTGDLDSVRQAYQDVPVKSYAGTRETFVLSGWAKGYGIVSREREGLNTPRFQLRAEIWYKGVDTPEIHLAEFSPCTEEWQLASVEFAKSERRQVQFVRVYCDYSYNFGTAYFDNIQLVRKSLETGLSDSDFVLETVGDGTEEEAAELTEDTAPTFEELRDACGNALTETTFTDGEFGTIYRSFGYNADDADMSGDNAGNDLIRETDARGGQTRYTVDAVHSRNREVTDRCGNQTAYEYDTAGRTTKVTSKDPSGAEVANVSYSYDAFDNLAEIVRGDGLKYVLGYNAHHELESIGIDGKTEKLITYTYKEAHGRLKQITYANGHYMQATYNSVGHMIAEKWYGASDNLIAHYKYAYDGQGNIVRSIDMTALKEYNYIYEEGKLVRAVEYNITVDSNEFVIGKSIVHTIRYTYDQEGNLTRKQLILANGNTSATYYEHNDGNTVVKYTEGVTNVTCHSKTDSFGRKVFDELQFDTGFLSRQYSYHAGEITQEHKDNGKLKSTPVTQLVSRITFADNRTLDYEYDAEERITKVTDSLGTTTEYTYDALGQLLTETVNGTVINSMEYDNYGNITKKNGVTYTYGDGTWKDVLTGVGDETSFTDQLGNPLYYLGHGLTWEKGRQLKTFDDVTFTYNANGIRTSKTVNGVKCTYTLDGAKILQYDAPYITEPIYDNEDNVCGLRMVGHSYFFQKNLQGDVIGITDWNGNVLVRYSYDAWGVCTIVEDTSGFNLGNINPFRYRSYFYDPETGLYYLQSRYYDPQTGRFINMDKPGVITTFIGVQFTNLSSYCINNPISFNDYKGEYPILVGGGLQVSVSVSFGGISVGAGFELIYFWASKFNTKKSSRCLVYFYVEPLNFGLSTLKNAININTYYNKMKFNPKKLISKPSFNAAVSLLTIWADHKKSFAYTDYEKRFDTWTTAAWGIKGFKSWSSTFTVYGAGKYWGISGGGISRSVSHYWMVYDLGNAMNDLMNSIKRQANS